MSKFISRRSLITGGAALAAFAALPRAADAGAFASFDPALSTVTNINTTFALSNANLTCTASNNNFFVSARLAQALGVSTGKYYWEILVTAVRNDFAAIGRMVTAASAANSNTGPAYCANGTVFDGTTPGGAGGFATVGAGQTLCIAWDVAGGLWWCRVGAAGLWWGNALADPATGANGRNSVLNYTLPAVPAVSIGADGSLPASIYTADFGASAFLGIVPVGFTAGFAVNGGGTRLIMID